MSLSVEAEREAVRDTTVALPLGAMRGSGLGAVDLLFCGFIEYVIGLSSSCVRSIITFTFSRGESTRLSLTRVVSGSALVGVAGGLGKELKPIGVGLDDAEAGLRGVPDDLLDAEGLLEARLNFIAARVAALGTSSTERDCKRPEDEAIDCLRASCLG